MRRFLVYLLIFLFSASLWSGLPLDPVQAAGATLFLSPGSGEYAVSKNFTVKVMVDSGGGVGINAAEGAITYDPAYITVSKLSTTESIFKLWTSDPAYSNTDGSITFGGWRTGLLYGQRR